MASLKDSAVASRPREKLAKKGEDKLADYELLAVLLRTGTNNENVLDLSKRILQKYPKRDLLDVSYDDLVTIKGLSSAKAATLKSAFELAKRSLEVKDSDLPYIQTAEKACEQCADIRNARKEHFRALFLNARSQLIHMETVFMGTVNAVNIHPREIFETALNSGAVSVLVVHNHPSGDTQPSRDDREVTRQLRDAGDVLEIALNDHIIIAQQGYYSFRESGDL